MTQPLALLAYERLLPGTQLVNRLQDLGYRVQTLDAATGLVKQAEGEKPIIVVADVGPRNDQLINSIGHLKKNASTAHIPVIAIADAQDTALQEAARAAGATLVVNETAILVHLQQFLEQALQVD
jgi:CheY-like chemotaxis protein